MTKLFVVSEARIEDYCTPYTVILGITSSLERAVQRVTEKFPGFVLENRREQSDGGLRFALRGQMTYTTEDGEESEDEYYSISIQPFLLDASRFARDGEAPVEDPQGAETALGAALLRARAAADSGQK